MLKKEYDILKPFVDKPWQPLTFKQIAVASKKRSNSYLFNTLKKFIINKILVEKKVGNVLLYSINYQSSKALSYLGFALEYGGWNKNSVPYHDLQVLMDKIPYIAHVTLLTGSYAKGTQYKKSDLDVVILIEDSCEPKKVYAELKLQSELNIPNIHLYVFRYSEFIEMLTNKEVNYGTEIVKNCLVLSQGQTYLKLIHEAIQHGFDGTSLS